jgi:flavin reductase (DIM6/NTAB) family NADH-FMN oxidoreductase RutF
MTLDAALFRQVMSRFASGVTVVTASHAGQLYGLTVSSFTSLSLEPRLALVCIDGRTRIHTAITESQTFVINILASDQEAISRHFAGPQKHDWSAIPHTLGVHATPVLAGALATLECRLANTFPGGDHTIVVGEIEQASAADGAPLVYYRAGYHALNALED